MSIPIIMHVNYCEQGQTILEICEKAVSWGYDGVEFRSKRTGVEETTEEYLDSIAEGVRKSGLKYVLFGGPGPNLNKPDKSAREAEIQWAINFFRLASERFKLTVVNTFTGSLMNPTPGTPYSEYDKHGSFIATEDQWKWATEFKELGKLANELGFRFAFETHMNYIHDMPAAAKKLADLIDEPSVGVNLDYGNAVYFPKNPSIKETIKNLGDKLFYAHLKNSINVGGKRVATSLADGEINHREYLRTLKETGFNGPICIEAPRAGDREWYAQVDLAYFKSVMKDLGWV
jgi:sugar phosphate isomerase/epimerase